MRKRSLIEWDDVRDRDLLQMLAPFRARARGRRLKELAQLGALAERAGLRVTYDTTGNGRLEGLTTTPVLTVVPTSAAQAVTPVGQTAGPAAPSRSKAHQSGLDELLDSVVGL